MPGWRWWSCAGCIGHAQRLVLHLGHEACMWPDWWYLRTCCQQAPLHGVGPSVGGWGGWGGVVSTGCRASACLGSSRPCNELHTLHLHS